jgi:hypothetical protein
MPVDHKGSASKVRVRKGRPRGPRLIVALVPKEALVQKVKVVATVARALSEVHVQRQENPVQKDHAPGTGDRRSRRRRVVAIAQVDGEAPKPPPREPDLTHALLMRAWHRLLGTVWYSSSRCYRAQWRGNAPGSPASPSTSPIPLSKHDVYIDMRHTGDYPFSNLYLFVDLVGPGGRAPAIRWNASWPTPSGRWYGKGTGFIHSDRVSAHVLYTAPAIRSPQRALYTLRSKPCAAEPCPACWMWG